MTAVASGTTEASVWAALHDVSDPEIPAISVVDLGVIRSVEASPQRVRVEFMPTFVGCPALDVMRESIRERLEGMAPVVEVEVTFAESWTAQRITPRGREQLRASGFALPDGAASVPIALAPVGRCPFCDSRRTVLENAFGPTLCRAIYYCTDCRQPFEQFKSV